MQIEIQACKRHSEYIARSCRRIPYSTDRCCYIAAILQQCNNNGLCCMGCNNLYSTEHCSNIAAILQCCCNVTTILVILLQYSVLYGKQYRPLLLHCSNIAMLLQYCCNVTMVCAAWDATKNDEGSSQGPKQGFLSKPSATKTV